MRIECPFCHTTYDVPDDKVTGRKVRCANCKSEWAPPRPAPPQPAPLHPSTPPPAAMPEMPRPFTVSMPEAFPAMAGPPLTAWPLSEPADDAEPRRWPLIAAWTATLLLVILAVALIIIRRDAIMSLWPASERLFAALGLH